MAERELRPEAPYIGAGPIPDVQAERRRQPQPLAEHNPRVILTRTPLRVSFAGGGTDLADFYERGYGAVCSTAIANYIYVMVKRHSPLFDEAIRLNYFETEEADRVEEIRNDIIREALRLLRIEPPIYISTIGDHPASAGLGGSSSFAVGLLNALYAFRGERVTAGRLAEDAAHVEIDILGQPIGKQDHYAAAFGGLNFFRFKPGGAVSVEPLHVASSSVDAFFSSLLMFWTGHQPDSRVVLGEQKSNIDEKFDDLVAMRDHACLLQELLLDGSVEPSRIGAVLDETWQRKRRLAGGISNPKIDAWYDRARDAGAHGGKLLGAGGGGCLLFVADRDDHESVRSALAELIEVEVRPEVHGSQVVAPFAT